jgi:hypothetical protein
MHKDDRIFAIVGAGVGTAVATIAALMWLGSGITVDEPQRAAVVVPLREAVAPETSAVQAVVAGPSESLEDSENEAVRRAVARLSAHPKFAALLVTDRLLTRFVIAVDAVAGGYSPRDEFEYLRPTRPFLVRESEGRLVTAAGSHRRYDLVAEVLDSIDINDAVELYRGFQPRLEAIFDDIGWSGEGFDARLHEAVDHLLEVEDVSGPFDLEQRAIVYAYADDRVEQLSDAQKQLLRMGPENSRRVLAKLNELRLALGWPPRAPDTLSNQIEAAVSEQNAPSITADAMPFLPLEPIADRTGAAEAP